MGKEESLLSTLKNSLIYILGSFFVRMSILLLLPLLTNSEYLSVKEFGIYTIVDITSTLFITVMGLGLYMGFARFYWDDSYKDSQHTMLFNTLAVVCLFSLLLLAVLWWISPLLSEWLFKTPQYALILQLAFATSTIVAISHIPLTLMRLQSKSSSYSFVSIIKAFTTLGFIWFFLVEKNLGLKGVFLGMFFSAIVTFIALNPYIFKNSVVRFNKPYLKELFKYTYPLFLSSILGAILGLLDRYVLNAQSSLENVAIYSIGFKLSNTIKVLVITSIQLALTPILMKKMNDPKHDVFYPKVLNLFSMGLMFVIVAIVLFSKELIGVFTGEDIYLDAVIVVAIISFGFYFEMLKDTVVIGLNIEKKTMTIGLIALITTVISVVLYKIMVHYFDVIGASMAFLLTQITYFVVMLYFAQKTHFIPFKFERVSLILLVGIILVLLSVVIKDLSPIPNFILRLLILLLYPAFLWGTKMLRKQDVLDLVKGLIKGK